MTSERVPADEPLAAEDLVEDGLSPLLRLRAASRAERSRRELRHPALRLYAVQPPSDRTD